MKDLVKSIGVISLVVIIGVTFIACSDDPSPGIPALTGTVSISGIAQVWQTLTANIDDLDGSGTVSYQWKRGTTNIGINSDTYTVQTLDAGSVITVTVTRTGNSGSITSAPTEAVTVPQTLTINFTQLQNSAPEITGPTIYIIGSEEGTTKTITVDNPSQYESIKWYFNGNQITGAAVSGDSGEILSLNSATYNKIGTYFITLEVKKDGKYYSNIISFTVEL